MRISSILVASLLAVSFASADIHLPREQNFYDRLGGGIANVVFAINEIPDSWYQVNQAEGPVPAATKGLVQGTSRLFMDMGVGIWEVVTSPIPIDSAKAPSYDGNADNQYPPSLLENWY